MISTNLLMEEAMPAILSVSTFNPPYTLQQELTTEFAKELFQEDFKDIERLLTVFQNGQIEMRNFTVPLSWFKEEHTLQERNDLYIEKATEYGAKAIQSCLTNERYLKRAVPYDEIEAIIFISSSGLSTPSIEARIMNRLPFSNTTKRIPIWGLGCAGGAAGLSRAFEYCLAFPKAKVLVLCVELCSLTFQRNDRSKSNLIGTSLFADGVAAALVVGDKVESSSYSLHESLPTIKKTVSVTMPKSEEVMGWDVKNQGLYVVFSRDIPTIINEWLRPTVDHFLEELAVGLTEIDHFIFHPGGKKVLDAYEASLHIPKEKTEIARKVLKEYGNMSSPTVLYVYDEFLKKEKSKGEKGLVGALGPGFSAEMLFLEWA